METVPANHQTISLESEARVEEAYPQLHHYTTLDAFQNIWQTGQLYATRYDYLNDPTEITFSRQILIDAISARLPALLLVKGKESLSFRRILNKAGEVRIASETWAVKLVAAL